MNEQTAHMLAMNLICLSLVCTCFVLLFQYVTAQSVSGTGALRLAGMFLVSSYPFLLRYTK